MTVACCPFNCCDGAAQRPLMLCAFSKKAAALVNSSADRLAGWSGMEWQCSEAASGAIFSRNSPAGRVQCPGDKCHLSASDRVGRAAASAAAPWAGPVNPQRLLCTSRVSDPSSRCRRPGQLAYAAGASKVHIKQGWHNVGGSGKRCILLLRAPFCDGADSWMDRIVLRAGWRRGSAGRAFASARARRTGPHENQTHGPWRGPMCRSRHGRRGRLQPLPVVALRHGVPGRRIPICRQYRKGHSQ